MPRSSAQHGSGGHSGGKSGGNSGGAAGDRDLRGWREEGQDLIRGIAAGSIVGMPLLYTMEMWWHGMLISEAHMLLIIAVALLLNGLFSLFSGFRAEYSAREAVSEAITSLGLSMVLALALLCLIGEVTFQMAGSEIIGRVVIVALPISLGVSFANSQIRGKSRGGDEQEQPQGGAGAEQPDDPEALQLREDLIDVAASLSGATIFAMSIAPTEEIVLIALRMSAWQHLLLMAASLGLCYLILFAAGFQDHRVYVPSLFQHSVVETMMAYATALLVAGFLLYLIGPAEAMSHLSIAVRCTVTLGLPAVVGAAAGRLIA